MTEFTHFNEHGQAHMVNVGNKDESHRVAIASGRILMQPQTLEKIRSGSHKKGDVLGVARCAGIMASKKTPELIPLCHPLALSAVEIDFTLEDDPAAVNCKSVVEVTGRTGVEIEALTVVQITLLTIYDMCKSVDRSMTITDICLLQKTGGKSGDWHRSN